MLCLSGMTAFSQVHDVFVNNFVELVARQENFHINNISWTGENVIPVNCVENRDYSRILVL